MKINPKKFESTILGKALRLPVIPNKNNIKIRKLQKVILLGLAVDNCLTFKDYILIYCNAVIRFMLCEE